MHTKTTFCLVILLMGSGMVGPASGQAPPSLPSMEAILEAREPLVRPDLQKTIEELEAPPPGTSAFQNLVIDRITLEAGVHRGLTLLEEDKSGVVTDSIDDRTNYFWKVSYSIGLNELFKPHSSRIQRQAKVKRQRALALAQAELREAVREEQEKIVAKYNEYRAARAKFEKSAGRPPQTAGTTPGGVDVEAGYLMRTRAMELLVLVGPPKGLRFEAWSRFVPEESEPEATTTLARR